MELTKKIFGVWILFKLKGSLNAETAPEFDKELLPEIERRMDIVLDFSELEFISSMGIRSIMKAAKKTYDLNHRVAICGMKDAVNDVIKSTGVDLLVDVYKNISDLPFASDIITNKK